jgi:class 3 adenylate cyclase
MVVMFIEIRGFAQLSAKEGPLNTLKLLNSISKKIIPTVEKKDGYIDVCL